MSIFTIIGAVVTGLGGSSFIILALSSWLGKVWASRIFEKEKVKYEKELQDYRAKIDKEMLKISAVNEKAIHTTKIQYDKEFEIYQNIWRTQIDCFFESNSMFGNKGKEELSPETARKRLDKFIISLNKFHSEIQYNAPFYKNNFSIIFVKYGRSVRL